ncbi:hypothetical protein PIB30_018215 [Stylosanthes scabra]|uniref:Piwi domain-containing protein n=1 Tax=Stylosanthes scabra TaxID=79078 RepID=A0ABU6U9F2_9FABA|nr:hypothetical protein [Stylosanthes scabra]
MPLGNGDAGLRHRGAQRRNRSNDKAVQRGCRQMAQAHKHTEDEAKEASANYNFQDGVSKSQFIKVLNEELVPIIEACKYLDEKWCPKFTFIVAQKNHHSKLFKDNVPDNVPPG